MRVNWSRIKQYQSCPRFYYWRYVLNLQEKRGAIPLIFGRAIHAALAAHYAGKPERTAADLDEQFEDEMQGLLPAEKAELEKHRVYAHFVIDRYREHYAVEPWEILAPEIEGSYALGEHQFYFRADGAVGIKGRPWLLETKTASQLGPTYFKQFTLDGQIVSYMHGMAETTGLEPVGAVINVIRKSKAHPPKVEFDRDFVTHSKAYIMRFMESVEHQADTIQAHGEDKEEWPMHTGYCVHYGRACEYLELCRNDTPDKRKRFHRREPDYVDKGNR